ncbi:hypothetical protein BH09BAC6_BH09BAC6_30080 [soil metagenome]|jgi:hypothetical protein
MATLTRDQVKNVVTESLEKIADLPDDIETAPLTNMVPFQQQVFLSALKSILNALPFFMDDGTTSDAAFYDVDLTPDSINLWATGGDCINWITANQKVVFKN